MTEWSPGGFDAAYERLRNVTPLYGQSYDSVIRALAYSLIANSIKTHFLPAPIDDDMRINLAVAMGAGSGKKTLISATMKSELEQYSFVSPTSYHPEQFVGKNKIVKYTKDKTTGESVPVLEENEGYLDADLVIIDEAIDLLTNPIHDVTRKYIRGALDPIGSNVLTKGSVDLPAILRRRITPKCTVHLYFQPMALPEALLTAGDFRRYLLIYPTITKEDKTRALAIRGRIDRQPLDRITGADEFREWLRALHKTRWDWEWSDDIADHVFARHQDMIRRASSRGPRIEAATTLSYFNLQTWILKMSCIRAACEGKAEVEKPHVEAAANDMETFFDQMLDFVGARVDGGFDYTPAIAKSDRTIDAISWLRSEGATAEFTGIARPALVAWIQNYHGANLTSRAAETALTKMLEAGIIRIADGVDGPIVWVERL